MCCCQILAIRRCRCLRRSTSTSTTRRITSSTAPGIPASKATGSHDGDEGPADGGVLGGLGPEPASLSLSAPILSATLSLLTPRGGRKPTVVKKTARERSVHSSHKCRRQVRNVHRATGRSTVKNRARWLTRGGAGRARVCCASMVAGVRGTLRAWRAPRRRWRSTAASLSPCATGGR